MKGIRSLRVRCGACTLLITLASVAVMAPAASSRTSGRAASVSSVSFTIQQPAGSRVSAVFSGGLTGISQQVAAGTSLAAATATPNGFVVIAGPTSHDQIAATTVIIDGQLTSGVPITGTATVPAGASMTASVNGGAQQTINNGHFSITTPMTLGASPGPTIKTSPRSVRAGKRVEVFGSAAGGCAKGDTVTLLSRAFANTYSFGGIPAIYAAVGSRGGYSVKTTIPARRKPGNYQITGRCGGGNLGVVAHLRVLKS